MAFQPLNPITPGFIRIVGHLKKGDDKLINGG